MKPIFRSRLLSLLALLLALAAAPSRLPAQVRIPQEALAGEEELVDIFRRGAELEQERRWADALTHYEEAVREFPGRSDLTQRLSLARMHLDVARRYHDAGFISSLLKMSDREALDVYAEVLLKIQTHYVDSPNWRNLVAQGTAQLQVAFAEPSFLDRNFTSISAERLDGLRGELPRLAGRFSVNNRNDARAAVAETARAVSERTGLPPQVVIVEYICAATGSLDPYSSFLTADQLGDVFSQIEGNFVGLGIELDVQAEPEALVVLRVIGGGPADRAGMAAGDRILAVDGALTADIDNERAADLLRGEEGSLVDLTILTAAGENRRLRIARARVEVPSVVEVDIIDRELGIGYLRITSFQKTTEREVDAALWKLHRDGMRSLLIDVRGNPGGLLNSSVEIADKFISGGNIVSTRGRSPREDFDYQAHNVGTWRVPLIVLIDGDSASASEIFAGAIRDHRRGTIVGVRSYGKGSVQGIFPLSASSAGVRLTTAKFYSPNGHPISGHGVSPDVIVRTTARPTGDEPETQGDPILGAGLQLARQQLSRR